MIKHASIIATMILVAVLSGCNLVGLNISVAGFGVKFDLGIDAGQPEGGDDTSTLGPTISLTFTTPLQGTSDNATFVKQHQARPGNFGFRNAFSVGGSEFPGKGHSGGTQRLGWVFDSQSGNENRRILPVDREIR